MGSMPALSLAEELDSILEKYTSVVPNHLRGAAFSAVNSHGRFANSTTRRELNGSILTSTQARYSILMQRVAAQ